MLFGSSGIRQKFSGALLSLGYKIGNALGGPGMRTFLGRDTRTSSQLLSEAVISGLIETGTEVIDLGVCPTPMVAYSARKGNYGCMITASHNPPEYNGFKFFLPDGSSFTDDAQNDLEKRLTETKPGSWDGQGTLTQGNYAGQYIRSILNNRTIRKGLPVIAECGNGAGSVITPGVLSRAGARVLSVNANPAGIFSRPSEPVPGNLMHIPPLLLGTGSKCAVVHDGDADRMMAFDNKGRYIGGDDLLVLFSRYTGAKKVVTTYDASMAIEDLIPQVRRTPVGDTYVSGELRSWGDIGGEPSGAWIFPNHSLCPDGPYAALLFCEMSSEWNIADEVDTIPHYPLMRVSIPSEYARSVLSELGTESPTDGIRVTSDSGWYLIRASGTEPVIRITAEGRTEDETKTLMEEAKQKVIQSGKEVKRNGS